MYTGRCLASDRHRFGQFLLLSAILSALGLAVIPGRVTQGQGSAPPKPLILFDGKSLEGWKPSDFSKPGEVKVEDGAILLKTGRPMAGITTSRRDLPTMDYELKYTAQRLDGSDFFAAATFPVGSSFITLVNGGWGGNVTGLSSLDGADASENDSSTYFKYQNGKWYKFRVRVTGKKIRCWIDEKEVVTVDYEGRKVSTRLETRTNQPLGFATWESTGALRGIEVRKLTPDEVAQNEKTAS
jgi:hypothetical protein